MSRFKFILLLLFTSFFLGLSSFAAENQSGYFLSGVQIYKNSDYKQAQYLFKKELEQNPKNKRALLYLAMIELNLKNYKEAHKYCDAVNSFFSKEVYPEAYYVSALIYYAEGKYFRAEIALENHYFYYKKKLTPKQLAEAYYLLANCYNKQKYYSPAVKYYKKAIESTPDNPLYYKELAALYKNLNKPDEAIKCLEESVLFLYDPELKILLAKLFFEKKEYDKANELSLKVLRTTPNDLDAFLMVDKIKQKKLENEKLARVLENLSLQQKAPKELHSLIKTKGSLKNPQNLNKLHTIVDILWTDPEGRLLLNNVIDKNVSIYLKNNVESSRAITVIESKNEPVIYFKTPSGELKPYNNTEKVKYIYIILKENNIEKFIKNDSEMEDYKACIMIFVHELCHVFDSQFKEGIASAKEEELFCSVIGMNIASKILEGRPLSENEANDFIYNNYRFILGISDYQKLPVYNDFVRRMTTAGIKVPFSSNFPDLNTLESQIKSREYRRR